MRTKTKKGLVDFKRKRSLGSVVPLLFLATGFNVVSANGVETFFNENYENDRVSVVVQSITGTIVDADGIPLPGATVVIKGTSKGTQTDFDGNFVIDANAGDVLEISYVGFKTQEIVVGDQTSLNVTLEQDIDALNEVVVVGYGTQKKSEITGASSQVKAESFEEQPVVRVEEALQGRTAGVFVARSNGTPGADAKIRVRGVNSITGANAPLVVVDGFIGGDLRTLNPADIETFEVLKDASALAIYGARGANGVILVTTKKGKGKTRVDVNVFTSVSELANSYDNRKSALQFALDSPPNFYSDEVIDNLRTNPVPDKEDDLFRTAFAQNYQVSLSGGTDKVNYFISGNYLDQQGIMVTNEYERYSLRANVESKVNEKLKIGMQLFANRETDNNNPNNFNLTKGGPVLRTLTTDPTFRQFNQDGSFNFNKAPLGNTSATYFVTDLFRSDIERRANRFNLNLNLEYKILPSLKYSILVAGNTLDQRDERFTKESPDLIDPDTGEQSDPRFNVFDSSNRQFVGYQITNILNWNKTFGKHGINLTGVYEFAKNATDDEGVNIISVPFDVDSVEVIDDSSEIEPESRTYRRSKGTFGIVSVLGRLNYAYDESLLLNASIRRDEATTFTKDNRVGVFYSFGGGYSMKKLSFIENSNVFNNVKIRGSWGQTGNSNTPNFAAFTDTFEARQIVGGRTLVRQNNIGNPNLSWEITEQWNVGADVNLFNNRLNFSVDYFNKTSEDLILRFNPIPSNRALFTTENIGEVENKGFEFSMNGDVINNDNLTWNSGIVFSHVKNEVTKLIDLEKLPAQLIEGQFRDLQNQESLNVIKVGEPIGSFFGFNEEGRRDVLGSGLPTVTWGFNNTVNYKKWDFNAFVQGAAGFDVYNITRGALNGASADVAGNFLTDLDEPTTKEGSYRYVEKGDYVRLSNLSLGYTITKPFKQIDFVKLYASGQNLFLITDYKGYDPETNSGQRGFTPGNPDVAAGIDAGAIPNPRTYTFGVKLGF
ncbi:SusC/RagA family TonB-linked outer membrane protein [Aquimarina agarilytica]|uniref:SusC/RagA family TonB-linked outer membrane protein n=1 Tax=Aquimarina agarilytica TaxID=1087449 RepID=UPI000289575F|nr:TonB-dependent receptor [Aquimarina agarilytica]